MRAAGRDRGVPSNRRALRHLHLPRGMSIPGCVMPRAVVQIASVARPPMLRVYGRCDGGLTQPPRQANTPGCTRQACGFRDNYKVFTDAGMAVFGVSDQRTAPTSPPPLRRRFRATHAPSTRHRPRSATQPSNPSSSRSIPSRTPCSPSRLRSSPRLERQSRRDPHSGRT